jgi:hypothetical protein
VHLSKLTHFVLTINAAIDAGHYQSISVSEMIDRIDRGNLMPYLEEHLEHFDVRGLGEDDAEELLARLQDISEAHGGNAARKWGVRNSGLCLLVAWTTELIAQGDWQD